MSTLYAKLTTANRWLNEILLLILLCVLLLLLLLLNFNSFRFFFKFSHDHRKIYINLFAFTKLVIFIWFLGHLIVCMVGNSWVHLTHYYYFNHYFYIFFKFKNIISSWNKKRININILEYNLNNHLVHLIDKTHTHYIHSIILFYMNIDIDNNTIETKQISNLIIFKNSKYNEFLSWFWLKMRNKLFSSLFITIVFFSNRFWQYTVCGIWAHILNFNII